MNEGSPVAARTSELIESDGLEKERLRALLKQRFDEDPEGAPTQFELVLDVCRQVTLNLGYSSGKVRLDSCGMRWHYCDGPDAEVTVHCEYSLGDFVEVASYWNGWYLNECATFGEEKMFSYSASLAPTWQPFSPLGTEEAESEPKPTTAPNTVSRLNRLEDEVEG